MDIMSIIETEKEQLMFDPDDVPQEAVDAYVEAWEAKRKEIGRGIAEPGTKVRAGLSATLKLLYEKGVID